MHEAVRVGSARLQSQRECATPGATALPEIGRGISAGRHISSATLDRCYDPADREHIGGGLTLIVAGTNSVLATGHDGLNPALRA